MGDRGGGGEGGGGEGIDASDSEERKGGREFHFDTLIIDFEEIDWMKIFQRRNYGSSYANSMVC